MKPQDVKHHICPCCGKQAIVLVDIKNNAVFDRDDMGNIQYRCNHYGTIFSIDSNGNVVAIQLRPKRA